jgi:spore germination cell wall hydrolase CwlJ-like protein
MKLFTLVTCVMIGTTIAFASATTLEPAPQSAVTADTVSEDEIHCMAKNIYFEAKSQLVAGQYAVADVVINRVLDTRYPNTVCEVVYDGPIKESWKTRKDTTLSDDERIFYPVRNRCQFSWYCDGKSDKIRDEDAWHLAYDIAQSIMIHGNMRGITEGATHYHADYVSPAWARKITLVGSIGDHIFYRWP